MSSIDLAIPATAGSRAATRHVPASEAVPTAEPDAFLAYLAGLIAQATASGAVPSPRREVVQPDGRGVRPRFSFD